MKYNCIKIDNSFVALVNSLEGYLITEKANLDKLDASLKEQEKNVLLLEVKDKIFSRLDTFFSDIWDAVKSLPKEEYKLYKEFYQGKILPLLKDSIEINRHIFEKPFGYSGDFVVMNYIFDYNGNNYLGKSSFEKLINNYTCNISIAKSNIRRKDFLKEKILEKINTQKNSSILSLGGGSLRELIELLKEGKIDKKMSFISLDFEEKAIQYVRDELNKINVEKRKFLSIQFVRNDIKQIIRESKISFSKQDMIYASGLFDYLSDRTCKRLICDLFGILKKGGDLIVCNISSERDKHRAYYETLGEWNMIHRDKKELISWAKDVKTSSVRVDYLHELDGYLYLALKK